MPGAAWQPGRCRRAGRAELNSGGPGPKRCFAPGVYARGDAHDAKAMYMKRILKQSLILITLSACSTSQGPRDASDRQVSGVDYQGNDCILIRSVRDYTPLDDRHLLIRGPANRAYFVTLFQPAFDMRGSVSIGFDSRDDQLCPFGGDAVVFGSLGRERSTIRSINRVSAEQEEAILIRFGLKEPTEPKAPEPPEVKGAEVEELG